MKAFFARYQDGATPPRMSPRIFPFDCSAMPTCLLILLIFLQPFLGLCQSKGPTTHTYASVAHSEAEVNAGADAGSASKDSSVGSLEQAGAGAHLWEATCGSYKSITLRFPELHASATYDLRQVVQGAPPTGWACKASEPLFELEEYPPFFRTVLSLMVGPTKDTTEKTKSNKLHKHKNKHVFFAFNPCRLLPHSCHGSRGRLFKFAAKLKKPHDPQEEMERLLAEFLKVSSPSSSKAVRTADKAEEEADTTECLQNVLSTNTTLLYSHRPENMQQHPDSNGIGGLWSEPEITDDPTSWEPLNPSDPFEGLQAHMHHVHIFCPESSLHTHVILKCPWGASPGIGAAAENGNPASATKFDLCEHPDPCRFNMVMTTPAACPTLIDYSGSAAAAAPSVAAAALPSGKTQLMNTNADMKEKANAFPASNDGQPTAKRDSRLPTPAASGAAKNDLSFISSEQQSSRASVVPHTSRGAQAEVRGNQVGLWQQLQQLLLLLLRVSLCLLIFAWIIYVIRDWKETKMQYADLPEEGKSEEDAMAAAGNLNSYDSCVKALAGASCAPVAEADSRGFQLAAKYREPPASVGARGEDVAFTGAGAAKAPRRELRGLYSSPGRRFVSVWLPQTVGFAARQAVAFSEGAVSACRKLTRAFMERRGAAKEFAQSDTAGNGTPWDWTDTVEFNDTDTYNTSTDSPSRDALRGLSGYETIS